MTTIQIYGRLGRAREQRNTAAGKAMVTVSMVVDLGRDAAAPEWFSLVAFATIGEVLAKHGKGDMVAVSGKHEAFDERIKVYQNVRYFAQSILDEASGVRLVERVSVPAHTVLLHPECSTVSDPSG